MRSIKKIIFLLTVVAILLAHITSLAVSTQRSEGAREGDTFTVPIIQDESPSFVEKPVENSVPVAEKEDAIVYDEEMHEILSIIIYQEAGGDRCSDDTRRKVGSVFLNRVASPLFPNTFKEVATGHRQYGTLYITGIKWPERATLAQEAHAVQRAKDIAEELLISGGVLPSNVIWQSEFIQGDGVYCHQDGIYFCYSEVNK